jgi:hypothetical protein
MQLLAYRKSYHSQLHEAALPRPVINLNTRRGPLPWILCRRNCLRRLNRSGTHHLNAGKPVHTLLYDFRSWLDGPAQILLLTYCFIFYAFERCLLWRNPWILEGDRIAWTLGIPCILEVVCVSRHHAGTWICNQWMYTYMPDRIC